jgi:penicillin-binding protein 1A
VTDDLIPVDEPRPAAQPVPGTEVPPGTKAVVRIARRAILVLLFLAAALGGTVAGLFFAYGADLPDISRLDDYQPNTITRLLASDGSVVAQFATERRVVVSYDNIAPALRQAIIAKEDADFEKHVGLSIPRILVTAARRELFGQQGGASTITQQLARDQFLREYMRGGVFGQSGWGAFERKVKEILIAMQLERRYTKREIFTFYANQINFGHGAYGVEAAARMYFNHSAKDVSLDEAASLAAIIQTPARLSPFVDRERNRDRRNYVLRRMADEHYITDAQAREAQARPVEVRGQAAPEQSTAPYFAEEIRKKLEADYGASALYERGLTVQTTLDPVLQEAANRALDRGLRAVDKRVRGYRKPSRNVGAEAAKSGFTTDRWSKPIAKDDIVPAVVTSVPAAASGAVRVRIGSQEVDLTQAGLAWTKLAPSSLFKVGDVIEVLVRGFDKVGKPRDLVLEQPPAVEGAIVGIDNRTGQIRFMSGGFSFARSKFNRATQARRQVGSLFKPFVYTAMLDHGYTPISVFVDEPVSYEVGPNQPPYEPLNYDRKYEGAITMRRALEDSRNVPAVKAMAEIGPEEVIACARQFGLKGELPPYLSLALGAAESTLLDMTAAYAAYPNQGVRMVPYSVISIADRDSNVLEEARPQPREAIRADTAFVMTNLLRGVVQHGTAGKAVALDWPLAGKTGTMDDYTDAWFIGFDPNITVGVWVGYDEKKPLGKNETGANAALPIWMDVMKAYIEKRASRQHPPEFTAPDNIVFVTLESGATEAFINGTEPQNSTRLVPAPAPAPAAGVPAAAPARH